MTIDPVTGNATDVELSLSDLAAAALGKNVILATHGFNVNQLDGYRKLSNWNNLLQLDNTWLKVSAQAVGGSIFRQGRESGAVGPQRIELILQRG